MLKVLNKKPGVKKDWSYSSHQIIINQLLTVINIVYGNIIFYNKKTI